MHVLNEYNIEPYPHRCTVNKWATYKKILLYFILYFCPIKHLKFKESCLWSMAQQLPYNSEKDYCGPHTILYHYVPIAKIYSFMCLFSVTYIKLKVPFRSFLWPLYLFIYTFFLYLINYTYFMNLSIADRKCMITKCQEKP